MLDSREFILLQYLTFDLFHLYKFEQSSNRGFNLNLYKVQIEVKTFTRTLKIRDMTRQEFFEVIAEVEKRYNKIRGCSACDIFRNCKSQNTCEIVAGRKAKFEQLQDLKQEYKDKFNANYDLDAFSIACGCHKDIVLNS